MLEHVLKVVIGCEDNSPICLALSNDGSILGIRDFLQLTSQDIANLQYPVGLVDNHHYRPLGIGDSVHTHAAISMIVTSQMTLVEIS